MKKIAVITATRAEYGLLRPLIFELMDDDEFDCNVIVTGTHLLEKYGNTVCYIEQDRIPIQYKIPIMDEKGNDHCYIIAKAMQEFSQLYKREKYDAIIVLGDRYELFGFCIPALINRIPIIHIHGGEKTEGAIDEKIRHAITKMSSIHFPSINEYAKRIIQMGENPQSVFAVGALGVDNALKLPLMNKVELEKQLDINFNDDVAIVTFHPVTTEGEESAREQAEIVFEALLKLPIYLLVTMPNSDLGGDAISELILKYVEKNPNKMKFVKSLGQIRYLSCLKYASIVIGNSSSGIIETASFNIPVVDIGDRQKGRFAPDNVIHCACTGTEIQDAVYTGLSAEFRQKVKKCKNPYGDGKAASRIKGILKNIDLEDENLIKKGFFDIDFEV